MAIPTIPVVINSLANAAYDTSGRLISSRMPISYYFSPRGSALVNNIKIRCYEDGTAAAKDVAVTIWKSGTANPLTTYPNTTDNWIILSTGVFDPSSVTATQLSSADWVDIPMSEAYIDAGGLRAAEDNNRNVQNAYAFTYAVTFERLGVNSDNGSGGTTDLIRYANVNSFNQGMGVFQPASQGNGQVRWFNNKRFSDLPIVIEGTPKVSSFYRDAPMSTWIDTSTTATPRDLVPGGFDWRSSPFTAVGSQVTRVAAGLTWSGARKIRLIGKIMTDDGSGNPNTVVACGHQTIETQGGNFFTGTPTQHEIPALFVFSADVTSGDTYHFTLEVDSFAYVNSQAEVSLLVAGDTGAGLNANNGSWFGPSATLKSYFQAWYVDSETNAEWLLLSNSPSYILQEDGTRLLQEGSSDGIIQQSFAGGRAYRRAFPNTIFRDFPVSDNRDFPKD